MKRLSVFVHFDRDNLVDEYVYYYLNELSKISQDMVFVTVSTISEMDVKKLEKFCTKVIVRENIGYDFMSYKIGIQSLDITQYDELCICNDSIYGPIHSLEHVFSKMEKNSCDFWGITSNQQFADHVQSYFIVFKRNVLHSDVFKNFWNAVKVLSSKNEIIFQYEIGLSQELIKEGFELGSYVKQDFKRSDIFKKIFSILIHGNLNVAFEEIKHYWFTKKLACNITLWFWKELIQSKKIPFIKVAALRDNKLCLPEVSKYEQIIKDISNYPTSLITNHIARPNRSRGF